MALAAHFTPAGRLTTTTVETVRFERPHRISFRLLRGPVPHVVETYALREVAGGTEFVYSGELGTDLWALGAWWADRIVAPWERAVATSLAPIQAESERRAGANSWPREPCLPSTIPERRHERLHRRESGRRRRCLRRHERPR